MVDMKSVVTTNSRIFGQIFNKAEFGLYALTGVLVAAAAAMSLVNAAIAFWGAVASWGAPREIILTIDRLLFVLMLLEVLHTVRISMKEGTLNADPFLVVGLIASIRRVLVITLGSSHRSENWTANTQAQFNASLSELAVLTGMIAVLVVAIFLLRRSRVKSAENQPARETQVAG
jgi:uncharacterized membrane protein (DUF373 family)